MTKKLTKQAFIDDAKNIHGDKYDYTHVVYRRYNTKVTIICPTHGEFKQRPNNHITGDGCPSCGTITAINKLKKPKSGESLGDKYPHLIPEWSPNNIDTPFDIRCKSGQKRIWNCLVCNHIWEATISDRTRGKGCRKCRYNRNYTGGKYLTGTEFSTVRLGAKARKIEFQITIADVENVYEKQNYKCAITNMPVEFNSRFDNNTTNHGIIYGCASIDRIDSTKGYVVGNIQIIHKYLNIMKGKCPDNKFREEFQKFISECIKYNVENKTSH